MASDYASISRYNEEQLGKDRASRMTQVAMYADTAHFIYELLQNADDVDADEISFAVYSDQLVVEHNGAPFNEKNVKSISYFGKGKTDITKIGHFGLGFKSVFAYTASPRIHSGSESFEITELYSIAPFPNPNDLDQAWTRFVLPFDHHIKKPNYIEHRKLKSPTDAQKEITEKLCKLGADALLFTKSLRTINMKSDGVSIYCRRTDCRIDDEVREVVIATTDTPTQCFLVFDRSVFWADDRGDKKEYRPVQIAYGLTKPLADGGAIKRLVGTHLHVFFPTDKETHHGIILQGPYRTTPARDNLPEDDDFNKHLVSETAPLLAQSLHRLKTLNLLGLDALAALPLDHERFLPGTFFHPLHTCVRHELTTKQLLPAAE